MDEPTTTLKDISGMIVDSVRGRGLEKMRIEAWEPEETGRCIASAVTDAGGGFQLSIHKEPRSESTLGQLPRLLFRIFKDGEKEPLLGALAALDSQLLFEVNLAAGKAQEGSTPGAGRKTARARRETATLINTGIHYDPRRVYRLVGRDLYSAPARGPLAKGEYSPLLTGVISELDSIQSWRVIVRGGNVWLTTT